MTKWFIFSMGFCRFLAHNFEILRNKFRNFSNLFYEQTSLLNAVTYYALLLNGLNNFKLMAQSMLNQ